jgi:hypothetical protein
MKILIDVPDDDVIAGITDAEMEQLIVNAVATSHDLDNGDTLLLASVRVEIVESTWTTRPAKSFGAWLKKQRHRDDPVGDLARDAEKDSSAPAGRATKAMWHQHIERLSGGNSGALEALDDAWSAFLRQ